MSKIIGIDLGTSNSAAAVLIGGKPTMIPSAEGTSIVAGGKAFPSYVAFTRDGQRLVGEPARRQAATNPDGTITGIKRKMGQDYRVEVFGKSYTPQDVSSYILRKIKDDAEAFLGEKVEKAVITVPAYFNDNQRQATKDAGTIAGLDVVRIINEPTAAALAYGMDKEGEATLMVFDFGGGTLDVTIMEAGEGVFEVKSTSGDTQLGGRDMDEILTNYVVEKFRQESGVDLKGDRMAMQRLREAVEIAKIELSSVLQTTINLPYITADQNGPKHLDVTVTRAKLEELIKEVLERCRGPMNQAIRDAKIDKTKIDKIVLVGGPTRMPSVRKFVRDFMGKEAEGGVDPMECVAIGAAVQGGVLGGEVKDILLLDVTPLSLGIETLGGVDTKLIERNTTIPTRMPSVRKFVRDFMGKEAEGGVDPMECVAIGAAVQGGVLGGEVKDILLLDVTPLSLGIETLGGVDTKLIERNTTIPTRKSQIFTTAADNQTTVEIHILQGERPMAKDNTSLGRFNLSGIPPAPRGIPQIEVAFDIDANGILNVSAKDLATGKEQAITISAPHKLSQNEIERKVREAEEHAYEDTKRKEEIEAKNQAETLVYTAEKTLKEAGEVATADQREKIEKAIAEAKEALADGEIARIKEKAEALQNAIYELSTAMYQRAAEEQQREQEKQQQSSQGSGSGETIDADYEVVDDKR